MLILLPQVRGAMICENLVVGGYIGDLEQGEIVQDRGAGYGYALFGRILLLDQVQICG